MADNKPTRQSTWLVEFPTFRYAEDVKALARRHGLRIVDAAVADAADREVAVSADKAPKLTLKVDAEEAKAKALAQAQAEAKAAEEAKAKAKAETKAPGASKE